MSNPSSPFVGAEFTDLQSSIYNNKYVYENESPEQWLDRVSGGNLAIRNRIQDRQFLFGGRILSNRGLHKHGLKVTYSNCYVLSPPKDTLESIFDTARNMARTYSYGGGCGTSLRNIRPRDAKVHNNASTTTGAVSFMPIYSLTTETIGQKGRRGALMLSIPSNHPDLEEFIDVKTKQGAITGANISIEIDDKFMNAVRVGHPYRLHFEVKNTAEPEVIEKIVDARKLYKKIIKNNLDWAEPGALYWDRISNYHLMSADPTFYFGGTNPCAEEPLPPGGSCLLGSINLSAFVCNPFTDEAYFDLEEYKKAIKDAVIALNEVLDEGLPLHPLEEQRQSVRDLRQIGLGVMGIYEMLIKLGLTYGEQESLELNSHLAHTMLVEALITSSNIAKELGSFNKYNYDYLSQSEFFKQNVPYRVKELIRKQGLRNSQLLCIAPTGSISTMLGISGGIEPAFSLEFERTTKSLHQEDVTYMVYADIVKEYYDAKGLPEGAELPEMFVTAHTLDWRKRIDMQAVWQEFIDASISSTINLREDITLEETEGLYMYAWEKGLKGATIYREGCERGGILVSKDKADKDRKKDLVKLVDEAQAEEEYKDGEKVKGFFSTCPSCKSENMVHANGCVTCQDCGFSPCS